MNPPLTPGAAFSVPAARLVWQLIAAGLLWLAALPSAHAHLMAAQHGTLNFVGDDVFMVLSLPVSAFSGVDDDGDGKLSMIEFGAHRAVIASAVMRNVKLLDEQGPRPLDGVMLSLATPNDAATQPAAQLVILGRFALTGQKGTLRFQARLFSIEAAERILRVTVTRGAKTETQLLVLTAQQPSRDLFPSAWSIFVDYVALGAEHIVTGLDHLLFLLVVLVAGWSWRQVLMALTAFTIGHALTLMISVLGGLAVPATLVEPTIAGTIVGMATFDLYARRRERLPSEWIRLALVFGCALVHGLGLASDLTQLGLDNRYQWQSLAGFNIGIELGQVAVALVAAIAVLVIQRLRGSSDRSLEMRTRDFCPNVTSVRPSTSSPSFERSA